MVFKPLIHRFSQWHRFWGEARTRIILWYVFILLIFMGLAIPLIRLQITAEVDRRVRADLNEELEDFEKLVKQGPNIEDQEILEEMRKDGQAIPEGYPQSPAELESLFELHLKRRIPEDDMFLISFVDGGFFRSSPRALPDILPMNSELMKAWPKLMRNIQGEQKNLPMPYGGLLYGTKLIKLGDSILGVFVVAHTTAGEQNEALEAFNVMAQVLFLALGIALLLIWWVAGRVLSPLRTLSITAHNISETDLSQRLPAEGRGEIADLAQTFNDMMDRLQDAFESQRNFINDAGHELRTPITIVQGHLELMGDDPQEREETIALVMDELERMNRLVNDLLLLAKTERVDFLKPESVESSTLVEEMYLKATALSSDRQWQIENLSMGAIWVDRQRITEAVMNLAENAVQHTVSGDRITIGSRLNRQEIEIWVKDTGEGIPLPEQQRIFERFARVTHARRRSEGSGLGLSIVKAIAEAHGGSVTLHSNPGTGSSFTLVLPSKQRSAPSIGSLAD
jgi:signal transduction histidine kinase